MQGGENCSHSVWHPCCSPAPASRTEEPQCNSRCSSAISPPAATAECRRSAVGCKDRNPLQTAGNTIDFQMQAFCRESKRNKADVGQPAAQLSPRRHPFGAIIPSRGGRGEKKKTNTQQCTDLHRLSSFNAV